MRKYIECILFILIATMLRVNAVTVTGETLLTTNFTGSTPNWTLPTGSWYDEPGYMTYVISAGSFITWSQPVGAGKDLASEFAGYDLFRSKLMGFDTDNITFFAETVHQSRLAGTAADYEFWVQVEIYRKASAGGGFYVLASSHFDPETVIAGFQTLTFSWLTSNTLGDLTAQGGIALQDIDYIQYRFIGHGITQYDGTAGNVYFRVNSLSLPYQVNASIPFPGAEGETLVNTNLVSGSGGTLIPNWTYPNTVWTWRNNVDPGELTITVPQDHSYLAAQSDAVGECLDLTTLTNITSRSGYDPSVSRLMGFDTDLMSFETRTINAYSFPQGSVFLQMEVDINLSGTTDFYRLTSTAVDIYDLPKNTTGTQTPAWSWETSGGALGDLTATGGVALADIDSITYTIHLNKTADYTDAAGNSYLLVDSPILPYRVSTPFETWTGTYGLSGGDEDPSADPDGDGVKNLAEFGIGGNPTNATDRGTASICGTMEVGGTLYFGYVHPQLADPDSGLTYSLELCSDLVAGNWTNIGYSILGTNDTGGDLDMVTNYTDMVDDQKFIRLRIEE